ncbi:MAG: MarR family transcriptional regulator, partial [Erysipelothrix sp.]
NKNEKNIKIDKNKQIDLLYYEYNALYQDISTYFGLSNSSLLVLTALSTKQPYTQKQLSEQLFLPKQTIHSSINSLVKSGILIVKLSDNNNKAKEIYLTDKGEKFVDETVRALYEAEKKASERLTDKEMEILFELTKKHLVYVQEEINKKFNL